jgi:hypothetical protein
VGRAESRNVSVADAGLVLVFQELLSVDSDRPHRLLVPPGFSNALEVFTTLLSLRSLLLPDSVEIYESRIPSACN